MSDASASNDTNATTRDVRVLLFAAARDAAATPELTVRVDRGCRVQDVVEALCEITPELQPLSGSLLVAVDERYATRDEPLASANVVALFPPVSGG